MIKKILSLVVWVTHLTLYSTIQATPFVIADNGGWCWFQGPRALIYKDKIFIGSITNSDNPSQEKRDAHVEVIIYDLKTSQTTIMPLHEYFQADDHNTPALLVMPDERILAFYTQHNADNIINYSMSSQYQNFDLSESTKTIITKGKVCYSNLFIVPHAGTAGYRIYNFYRGIGRKPNVVYSDDGTQTWSNGKPFLTDKTDRALFNRPYVRYAMNKKNEIHFIATQGHPNEMSDTTIAHGFIYKDKVYGSRKNYLATIDKGPDFLGLTVICHESAPTKLWISDIVFDDEDRPVIAFTKHNSPQDSRYWYGRWQGSRWKKGEIAKAGSCLYAKEQYYTGNMVIDPNNHRQVFISTNVHPETGIPLISVQDGKQHYEIFKGMTVDEGDSWEWIALTEHSIADNIRPIVPQGDASYPIVIWLQGDYRSYKSYDLKIVGMYL